MVYVPLRASSVDLDFDLAWNEEKRAIVFSNGKNKEITIHHNVVTLKQNDEVSVVDIDVEIHHGIAFVPADFLADFLDAELTIDALSVQLSTY